MLIWIALLALASVKAAECNAEQFQALFFAFQPQPTSLEGGYLFDNAAKCTEAHDYTKAGDTSSDAFIDAFCECAVFSSTQHVLQANNVETCTVNGQTVEGMMNVCQGRLCDGGSHDACLCDRTEILAKAPVTTSEGETSAVLELYCTGRLDDMIGGDLNPTLDANVCGCFNYADISDQAPYYGCRFGTNSDYEPSMTLHTVNQICLKVVECQQCFDQDGLNGYNPETSTCELKTACTATIYGCVTDISECAAEMKQSGAETCRQCVAVGGKWDGSRCAHVCPSGSSCSTTADECNAQDPCNTLAVDCGDNARCHSPGNGGWCWCNGVGYGSTDCTTPRADITLTLSADDNLSNSDVTANLVYTSGALTGVMQSQVSQTSWTFNVLGGEGNAAYIDLVALNQVCYFVVDGQNQKLLDLSAVTADGAYNIECFLAGNDDGYNAFFRGEELTRENFLPYINSELITGFVEAYEAFTGGQTIEAWQVNIEDANVMVPEEEDGTLQLQYFLASGFATEVKNTNSAGISFLSYLESALSNQPNLAEFWRSKTFSLNFEVEGKDGLDFDTTEMREMLAAVAGMTLEEVLVSSVSLGADIVEVNAHFSSSDSNIDALVASVADESFQSAMEEQFAHSESFQGTTITVTNSETFEFSVQLVVEVDDDELKEIFVAEIPYLASGVNVQCSSLGTQSHQCKTILTGNTTDLDAARTTIESQEFRTRFAQALVSTSMNGGVINWDGSLTTDQTWSFPFELTKVTQMNSTELQLIVAQNSGSGITFSDISVKAVLTGHQAWTVTTMYFGSQTEIINVQNNILSGAWETNTQADLSASSIFAGSVLSLTSTESQVSWVFQLDYGNGPVVYDADAMAGIIAGAFKVDPSIVEVTSTNTVGNIVTVYVLFTTDTSTAQLIILSLGAGSYQIDFENGISSSGKYTGATVLYGSTTTLTYIVYMYTSTTAAWPTAFAETASAHYNFDVNMMTIVPLAIAGGFSYQVGFSGTNSEIIAVMDQIQNAEDLGVLQTSLEARTEFADVRLETGAFTAFNPCESFYFLYDGQCDVEDNLDIMFVIDSSGTIDDVEFENMISFLKVVMQNSLPSNTRTSVMQFATTPHLKWAFEQYGDLPGTLNAQQSALDSLSRIGGATYTILAVEEAIRVYEARMATEAGQNRKRVLVILTDGAPTAGWEPCSKVAELDTLAITRMVIGVGSDWAENADQVTCLATENKEPYVVALPQYDRLADAQASFNQVACPSGVHSVYVGTYQQSKYLKWNDRFMYNSATLNNDIEIVYNGVEWVAIGNNTLISVNGGDGEAPVSIAVWNENNPAGENIASYDAMIVECSEGETAEPTMNPSAFVTPDPTTTPAIIPTTDPVTDAPSMSPTVDECEHLIAFRFGSCERDEATDMIFMIDGSFSIAPADFQKILVFLTNQVNILREYGNHYRFGVLQFGAGTRQELGVSEFSTLGQTARYDAIIDRMSNIQQMKGATYTYDAMIALLNSNNDLLATSTNGDLSFVQPIVVLLTDGDPTPDYEICTGSYDAGEVIQGEGAVGVLISMRQPDEPEASHTAVNCFATSTENIHLYENVLFENLGNLNLENATGSNCLTKTPFDGKYRKTAEQFNGEAVYEGYFDRFVEKITLKYEGNSWFFRHDSIGTMICLDNERRSYPPDLVAWDFHSPASLRTPYSLVRIECVDEFTPTATPTNDPTTQPTKQPSSSPTTKPSPIPSPLPSKAPIGMTRPPSTTPDHTPSQSPSILPTVECECYDVWPGLCEDRWGMDFVFVPFAYGTSTTGVSESNFDLVREFYKRLVLDDDLIADPEDNNQYGRGESTLGTVTFAEEPSEQFYNTQWDHRHSWLEALDTMQRIPDSGANLAGAVRISMFDLFTKPGDPRKDQVMIIVTETNDYTDSEDDPCQYADDLRSRGITTLVIGIGLDDNKEGQNPSCLAYSLDHYVNLVNYDALATLDVRAMLCNNNLEYAGRYQRFYPNMEDGSYRYVSHWGRELFYQNEEFWVIKDGGSSLIARGGTIPYPPDKQTWDFVPQGGDMTIHYYVRLTCCPHDIPTRIPSVPPTTPPTTVPTTCPTTDEPTSTPSNPPSTDQPSKPPSTFEPTSIPSTTPTSTPSMPPTTDEPTTPPTTCPTTDQPSRPPTTEQPTTPPSTTPSTPPTIAPSPDCECFIVGWCYCYPDHDSEMVCFDDLDVGNVEYGRTITKQDGKVTYMTNSYNGRYCRTDEDGGEYCEEEPRPVYENPYGWKVFWNCEAWMFEGPYDENGKSNGRHMGMDSELSETSVLPWPDNWRDWLLVNDDFSQSYHHNLTICCSDTSHPTRNPTTDEPTTDPSTAPFTFPPTSVPSSPPTSEPSCEPSTSRPTSMPSTMPTTDAPTTPPSDTPTTTPSMPPTTDQPTTMPTDPPSTMPFTEEPTSIPSKRPSPSPSKPPTTSEPTTAPTTIPTPAPFTYSPTVPPTKPPTDDCLHFIVGYCPCTNATVLDILLIVDGSNTIIDEGIFRVVQDWVKNSLVLRWEEGITFGSMQFGTNQENMLAMGQHDYQTIFDVWDAATPIGSSTFMVSALIAPTTGALDSIWKPYIQSQIDSGMTQDEMDERKRLTLFFTDGEPTRNQDPCEPTLNVDIKQAYEDWDITIIPVVLQSDWGHGDYVDHVGCLQDETFWEMYYIESPDQGLERLEELWSDINVCRNHTMTWTPYNGGYTRTGEYLNDRPVYVHTEGWKASHTDETWQFTDPNEKIGPMSEITASFGNMPQMEPPKDYTVELTYKTGDYMTIREVEICCVHTSIPTRSPSPVPTTDEPTTSPSKPPTSVEPSSPPSPTPTSTPSFNPTTDEPTTPPTTCPTTDQPSRPPTTDEPTSSPSVCPTTDEPSRPPTTDEPTTSPSMPPTTDQPSRPPTTEEPTTSPSVNPTTDEPTPFPSVPPTISPTDDCTDLIVGICDCVDEHGNPDIMGPFFTCDWSHQPNRPENAYVVTQYNGGYSRTTVSYDGYPTYVHSNGWILRRPHEGWVFVDKPTREDQQDWLWESKPTSHILPETHRSWIWSEDGTVIQNVSICCVKTTIPTHYPTPLPSEMPTSFPSDNPTTDEPTTMPSSHPTTDEPTDFPTTYPTSTPTSYPSENPTTDQPTTKPTSTPHSDEPTSPPSSYPTDSPSLPPTTDEPSSLPTSFPTYQPTVPPTRSPTNDCEHIGVGKPYCPCVNFTILDVVVVLDGSVSITTDEWKGVIHALADHFENDFPCDTARFGFVVFSTFTEVIQPLQLGTGEEHAAAILSVLDRQPEGNTFMKTALTETYKDVWKPDLHVEPRREKYTIFITDGEPSIDQNPCQYYRENYAANDVVVLPVCVGDECNTPIAQESLNCLVSDSYYFPVQYFDNFDRPNTIFGTTFGIFMIDCNVGEWLTPFNGWYTRMAVAWDWNNNERPRYRDLKRGFEVQWDGEAWHFFDFLKRGILTPMAEITGSTGLYPYTMRNWTQWTQDDRSITWFWVIICCHDNPTPTCNPTVPPTPAPTSWPSSPPSVPPTRPPTTDEPTSTPSMNPTTDQPTSVPSPKPTTSPSTSPTTAKPTTPPTTCPTTAKPTTPPTTCPTTDEPSRPPTTDEPTTPPTSIPSNPPTSVQPTTMPTSSPTASPDTSKPTHSPTTDQPTKPPTTTKPSPIPSPSPSRPPTTVKPTTSPTTTPSTAPTTVKPTTAPSTTPTTTEPTTSPSKPPTTDMPTVTPTKPPTNECVNFHFCWCCTISCGDSLDVLMIVDASSSISTASFNEFMNSLAEGMNMFWPTDAESKFGLVQFGSRVVSESVIPIDVRSRSAHAELIRQQASSKIGGHTATYQALTHGVEMWKKQVPSLGIAALDEERRQWTFLVTDGVPTGTKDVCTVIPEYRDRGVELALVGLGDATDGFGNLNVVYDCFAAAGYQAVTYDSWEENKVAINSIFGSINICPNTTIRTPYDGPYKRCEDDNPMCKGDGHGKPIYIHPNNFLLSWHVTYDPVTFEEDGYWEFRDDSQVFGRMLSTSKQHQIFPEHMANWTYLNYTRQSQVSSTWRGLDWTIHNFTCPIYCSTTPTPTRMPSTPPSPLPTTSPSDKPTTPPTSTPTTDEPTTPPSTLPTTIEPTTMPTTDEPSRPPTTDEPTTSPSKPPTSNKPTSHPSTPPTTSPSCPPTSTEPSRPPTTEQPTTPPSTSPSTAPTTDEPTDSPSLPPSTSRPTTEPTTSPETSQPSTPPTAQPTMTPTPFPTPCVCDDCQDCPPRLAQALNECKDWSTNTWIKNCVIGEEAMTCDECFDGEIDSINSQLRYLRGGVTQYDSCYSLKTTVLSDLQDTSDDLEALVLKLQADDTEDWQRAFTQYSMDCAYVPSSYCASMKAGSEGTGSQACKVCNGACVAFATDCD